MKWMGGEGRVTKDREGSQRGGGVCVDGSVWLFCCLLVLYMSIDCRQGMFCCTGKHLEMKKKM